VLLCRQSNDFEIEEKNRAQLANPRIKRFRWLRVRKKTGKTIYRLLGVLPLMLVRHKTGRDSYRLFGFIPLFTKRTPK
jgi:hypothetical protein